MRIHSEGSILLEDVRELLAGFEAAYNGVFAFKSVLDELMWLARRADRLYPFLPELITVTSRGRPVSKIWPFLGDAYLSKTVDAALLVPDDARLVLRQVHLSSPGEIVGSLNPLQQLREYLKDRHERRKDREYRESSEDRKLRAEARKAEFEADGAGIKVLAEQIRLAKELGVGDLAIRRLTNELIRPPLRALGRLQDTGLIRDIEVEDN